MPEQVGFRIESQTIESREHIRGELFANQQATILLVRPDGIGDEILCLPVASALRRGFPKARIIFLSSQTAAPILAYHPDLDEVLTVAGQQRFADLVALFRRGIDAAVFLKPFQRLMLAAFVARVPVQVATGFRWYSFLANRRIYQHRTDFSRHESEYNLHLLTGLDMEPGPVVRPRLVLRLEELAWARARLAEVPPQSRHTDGRSVRLSLADVTFLGSGQAARRQGI